MDRQTENLLFEISSGHRPSADTVADTLLMTAVRYEALDAEEADCLLGWDLPTIVEFLALRLKHEKVLSAQDVHEIVGESAETQH
jgi:hypothetical protein